MVRIIDGTEKFIIENERVMDLALERMGLSVVNGAKIKVPYKGGDLQDEIRHERLGILRHRVIADKEYATYQEKGQRKDGSHVVRKYSTPGTGKHYLRDSALTEIDQSVEYFKQAANSIRLGL